MKKLIVMTAAITLAVASQAAVVDWGYKITNDKTVANADAAQASAYANNYTVYLFAADAVSDWSKLTQDDLASAKDSAALKYQSYASRTGANYATTDDNGVVANVRTFDVGDADSYVGKIVVVDTVNNTYAVSDMTIASRSETAGSSAAGVKFLTQAAFSAQSFGEFYSGDTPTPGPMPEPTSGLLLLVGGAMLALRRKQK